MFSVWARGCVWDMAACGIPDEVAWRGAAKAWVAGFEVRSKVVEGCARVLVRLEGVKAEVVEKG